MSTNEPKNTEVVETTKATKDKGAKAVKTGSQIILEINGKSLTPYEIFKQVQTVMKVGKNKTNNFAKFQYRSVEDIMNAFKALGAPLTLVLSDDMIEVGGKVFVKASATVKDLAGNIVEYATAHAELGTGKAGMSSEQATGSASSYARKYACNGLFLLDDSMDPDSDPNNPSNVKVGEASGNILDTKAAVKNLQNIIMGHPARTARATELLKNKHLLKLPLAEVNAIIAEVEAIK